MNTKEKIGNVCFAIVAIVLIPLAVYFYNWAYKEAKATIKEQIYAVYDENVAALSKEPELISTFVADKKEHRGETVSKLLLICSDDKCELETDKDTFDSYEIDDNIEYCKLDVSLKHQKDIWSDIKIEKKTLRVLPDDYDKVIEGLKQECKKQSDATLENSPVSNNKCVLAVVTILLYFAALLLCLIIKMVSM